MSTPHTPGPWGRNIKPASRYPVVFAGRNTHVAMVITKRLTDEVVEANCDLIAAAPDLLAALLDCEARLRFIASTDKWGVQRECVNARAAIAKATGVAL